MRIYTATPMAVLDETDRDSNFFSRDMGLTCHGLQAAGIDSKVVLLDFPKAKKHRDMVRSSLTQMGDARFWESLGLDAVVLGAWSDPKYTFIARAVHQSGTRLMIRCDTGSPYSPSQWSLKDALYKNYLGFRYKGKSLGTACLLSAAKTGVHYISSAYVQGVIKHMSYADLIMNETPEGVRLLKALLCRYGRQDIAARVKYMPHPVAGEMGYHSDCLKEKRIIAVGRWDHYSKNTPLLVRALAGVLAERPDYEAHIFGGGGAELEKRMISVPEEVRRRMHIRGRVLNTELADEYRKSQILFMPSRSEGSSVAAEEALGCGCSVVGGGHIFCMRNFVSKNSGTLARKYSAEGMIEALNCEINAWNLGLRNAEQIAQGWGPEVRLEAVVREIVSIAGLRFEEQ